MANPIIMPKLGQMTEESTVVRWLKQEGESVSKGEILLEIETDKATMEVESFYDGVLLKILIPEGETVPVMATLGFLGAPGESLPEDRITHPSVSLSPVSESTQAASQAPEALAPGSVSPSPGPPEGSRLKISPRAAGLALSRGVDARQIRNGSGPGGRIVEKDVLAFLNQAVVRTAPSTEAGESLSTMRRVIAQRLTESYRTAPHFFVTIPVDMTQVKRARAEMAESPFQPSVTDYLVEAVAQALGEYPRVNATTDGKRVVHREEVHVGVAVALEDGLVVPVVRDARRLTLEELSAITRDLVAKARSGKLKPEEMSGSTFTVSNLGMLGVESFTAIINPGESAILAVSSTTQTPVVTDGEVTIRPMMKMTLSADHRLIDGALAARFLNAVKERLESR
jgi:pyruvate dehydrogenase E2 component (dihydrolipoamide acetyltransferase)